MQQEAIAPWARVDLDGFNGRYGVLIIDGSVNTPTTAYHNLSHAFDYEPAALEELEACAEPHDDRSSPRADTADAGVLITRGISIIVWRTRYTGPIRSPIPSPADSTTASSRIHTDAAKVTAFSDTVLVSIRVTWDRNDPTHTLPEYVCWAISSTAVWRVPEREEYDHWGEWDSPRFLVKTFILKLPS